MYIYMYKNKIFLAGLVGNRLYIYFSVVERTSFALQWQYEHKLARSRPWHRSDEVDLAVVVIWLHHSERREVKFRRANAKEVYFSSE